MAKLCAKGKAAAKRKFKVYPSAYANMYASGVCSGKIKPGGRKKASDGGYFDEQTTNVKGKTKTKPIKGGKTPMIPGKEFKKFKEAEKRGRIFSARVGGLARRKRMGCA
jgi:hypothetical protein